jgi:hypothetical protein
MTVQALPVFQRFIEPVSYTGDVRRGMAANASIDDSEHKTTNMEVRYAVARKK